MSMVYISLGADLRTCHNVNGTQHCHREAIDMMLSNITNALYSAGNVLHNKKGNPVEVEIVARI